MKQSKYVAEELLHFSIIYETIHKFCLMLSVVHLLSSITVTDVAENLTKIFQKIWGNEALENARVE